MKKFLSVVLLLFCGAILHAQNDFQKIKIQVLPSSNLTIIGDSNIAKFQCKFDTDYLKGSQEIYYRQAGDRINFKGAILVLNNRGFDCGSRGINSDFHDLLKTREHPEILLEMSRVDLLSPTKGVANVGITIAGIQKYYDVPVMIKNGIISEFKGALVVNINDFKLEPPKKLFGMIKVKDEIEINFDLFVKK
jgi:hypothetical protein